MTDATAGRPTEADGLGWPAARGFRMPAEWEPHRGTWFSWPHNRETWPGKFEPVPAVFVEMIRHLLPHEEVHVNVPSRGVLAEAESALHQGGIRPSDVHFHHHLTNDSWCRDHGPIFVRRERDGATEELILDWGYNAWGGKYPPFEDDDRIPTRIGAELGIAVESPGIILEGGSIDVNGCGTLLTTEACLLNPNRNPHLGRDAIEGCLQRYLGVTKVLWLGDGIEGDDTDGHIDDLTRFVSPTRVVTVVEDDPSDVNYRPLRENLARLETMTDQSGLPLEIVTLPMPRPLHYDGRRLPASYANFYVANGVVLLPGYDADRDGEAKQALEACFPDREVVVIDCRDLVWGLGAIHCVTQQWPGTPPAVRRGPRT